MYSTTYKNALSIVEWPDESRIPALRCPVTGMVVSTGFGPGQDPDRDAPLEPVDEECPSLLFRYSPELGFDYIEPGLAEAIERRRSELIARGEDEELLDDHEVVTEHLDDLGEAPLIIDMTTRGLPGDGIVVGLDLARAYG